MENASKALIMAAEVLIGVIILSIGVYLFTTFGEMSAVAYDKVEQSQISQFNTKFLKYYGNLVYDENGTEKIKPISCTAHDIISLASLAQQNNIDKEVDNLIVKGQAPDENWSLEYIRIDVADAVGGNGNEFKQNLENLESDRQVEFIKNNSTHEVDVIVDGEETTELQTKYFKCTKAIVSDITKKVCYLKFEAY